MLRSAPNRPTGLAGLWYTACYLVVPMGGALQ